MKMKIQRCTAYQALRRALVASLSAAAILTSVATTFATPLSPGGILFPAPAGIPIGGVLFNAPLVNIPFASATFTGTLTSEVFASDPTNPLGGLTFVYQIANTTLTPGQIERLTVNGYGGFLTNADYVTGTGTLAPAYIDRSSDIPGATVGFSFAPIPVGFGSIQPGQNSDLLIVYTNATNAAVTQASVIDGSVTQVSSYAPHISAPEPSTLLLAGVAALGLVAFARRFR
jgi:hypothetical protein